MPRLHSVWSRLLDLQLTCLIVARDPWPIRVLLPHASHYVFFLSLYAMEIIRSNCAFEQGRPAQGLTHIPSININFNGTVSPRLYATRTMYPAWVCVCGFFVITRATRVVTNSRGARGQSSSFVYNENRGFYAREMYIKCDRPVWFDVPLHDMYNKCVVSSLGFVTTKYSVIPQTRFTCFKACSRVVENSKF